MKHLRLLTLGLFVISMLSFFSCGGSGGGGSSAGVGTLSLSMVDTTSDEFKAVYVTVERVEVHLGGNENSQKSWKVVAEPGKTVNLLELVNEVRTDLGVAELKEGRYTQMRLYLGREPDDGINILFQRHDNLPPDGRSLANYAITHDDQIIELKTPSGHQTGYKIVQGFKINANETTELELDFLVSKSIVFAGNGDKLLLKPTIKVREPKLYALVKGRAFERTMVEATEQIEGIPGALVSAQILQSNESDLDIVHTSTLTADDDSETEGIDEKGQYSLIAKPAKYNLVVSKNGYGTDCREIDVSLEEPGATLGPSLEDVDFEIFPASKGSVSVKSVTISGADDFQHVTLSFRKQMDCIDSTKENASLIEVKSFNVANNIESPEVFSLPADRYIVVASTYDRPSKILDWQTDCENCTDCSMSINGSDIPCIEVSSSEEIRLNIDIPSE